MKPRVHELAAELGVSSREVIALLRENGEYVRGPSSAIEPPVARLVRERFRGGEPGRRSVDGTGNDRATPEAEQTDADRVRLDADPRAPSSRQHGWYSNPVRPPIHPDLLREMSRAERRFPRIREQREALNRLGSQIVYIAPAAEPTLSDCAVALVRFSGAIESAFGLTREAMILYVPYSDLQVRTYEAAFRELKLLNRNVTADLLFISSPDVRSAIKLEDWSTPGRLAVPFNFDESDPVALIGLLQAHLHARDLFYETTPVFGANFFGRKTLLRSLREDVLAQRVSGIFGLRKAGKTSTLRQLQENLREDQVVSVLLDLEAFPSPPEDPVDDILADARRRIIEELRAKDIRAPHLTSLPEYPSIQQFKTALQTLLRKLESQDVKLLLLLDEIEYLTPSDSVDIAEGGMPRIAQFLAALRSIVQETTNFTFILSGLTSAILESGRLYGRPNPLFSWAKANYIGPLNRAEADGLATSIGARMGLTIDPGALEALHEASGGHAYLYRNLASSVVGRISMATMQRRMTRADVLSQLQSWARTVRGNVYEMIAHVERYYPAEAVFLQLVQESADDLESLVNDEPEAARHLIDLGLIQESSRGEYELSVLLELR